MSAIMNATDETFERDVMQSDVPVLVDFWGDHCSACLQIAPILAEIAAEHAGTARVVKIHAAENPRAAGQFGVRAMPTVLAIAGGVVCGQLVGARPKSAFVELLEAAGAASSA